MYIYIGVNPNLTMSETKAVMTQSTKMLNVCRKGVTRMSVNAKPTCTAIPSRGIATFAQGSVTRCGLVCTETKKHSLDTDEDGGVFVW